MCAQLKECDITVNPIVNTQNSLEYIKLIEEYNMGFTAKSGDADDLAKKC